MPRADYITLDLANKTEREYIIKDLSGITIGRVYILDLDKQKKYCLSRIKLYKNHRESYNYLSNTIELMLKSLFNKMNIDKINFLVEEDMTVDPFIDYGFELEGFLHNNINNNGKYKSELIFGIDIFTYKSNMVDKKFCIYGDRIYLKILTPEHSEDMLNYCLRNKAHLKPYEPKREESYYTLEVQRQGLLDGYKQFLNGKSVSFGIFKDYSLIGKIRLSNIVMGIFKNANIGYSMDEKEQGKGYMKEAVKLAIDYGFSNMDIHRIEASAMLENIKSQKVLNACGFKRLGINENYLYINGEWKDHITFYKIKSE